jgi:hypothetical protein
MTSRINGTSFSYQNLTGNIQYYICYLSSPGCFITPDPNPPEIEWQLRKLNVQVTESLKDQSQRNFEILLQSIGLRAMPTIMSNPEPVLDLSAAGAPSLTGEGFVWKFAVERNDTFQKYTTVPNPVGLLIDDLDGVVIDSNIRVTTVDGSPSGVPKNIEFIRKGNL